ncbi:MAG: hypothetical protein Q4E73_10725 [Lachnospiraceae bacterium]|nr:hypothetical protein [Lachnospiraceae bacterium]
MRYEYRAKSSDVFYCETTRHADVPIDENTCDCREYEVDKINAVVLKSVKQIGELAERKFCIAKSDSNGQRENVIRLEREIGQLLMVSGTFSIFSYKKISYNQSYTLNQ